jgi:hypothetical protein
VIDSKCSILADLLAQKELFVGTCPMRIRQKPLGNAAVSACTVGGRLSASRAAKIRCFRSALGNLLKLESKLDGTEQASPAFAVRHYSVAEIAAIWNLSDEAVRGIFANEPGVLVLGDLKPRGRKRHYTTLRIPEFVVERVHRRLSRV